MDRSRISGYLIGGAVIVFGIVVITAVLAEAVCSPLGFFDSLRRPLRERNTTNR